jgi:hypothetical protein
VLIAPSAQAGRSGETVLSVPNNGGPAFPQHVFETRDGAFQCSYDAQDGSGMSLRDYFAAKAMESMVRDTVAEEAFETYQQLAADAYLVADAMLAERERVK